MNVKFDSKHTTEDDEGTTDDAGNDVIVAEMERNVVMYSSQYSKYSQNASFEEDSERL